MKKITYLMLAAALLLTLFSLLIGSCDSEADTTPQIEGEGFAIYLTADDVPPDQLIMMSHIETSEEPLLTTDDIVSYDAQTHEILLAQSGLEKLSDITVPMNGKSFVVCLNGSPVYAGAFWSPLSSALFQGVTIYVLPGFYENRIQVELGYPSKEYYLGQDVRNDAAIMKSLKEAGKLVNELPSTLLDKLPDSMKGYELYSWKEEETWRFRLITGTNRDKTYEEIISDEESVADWVSLSANSTAGIESILSKLPSGTEVFWLTEERLTQSDARELKLPEEALTETLKHYAEMCGIKLNIP